MAKLYADFGDVFDDKETEKDTFWGWWKAHAHLFWEKEARKVVEVKDVVDAEETDLVSRIAMEVRTAHVVKQVRRLLRENETKVKAARAKSRAKYPIHAKVNLSALYKHLLVYDVYIANPNLKLHEVADIARLIVSERVDYYDENVELAGKQTLSWLWRNGYDDYAKNGNKVVKRRKTQIARQHINAAKEYIVCVEKDYFPCRSLPK